MSDDLTIIEADLTWIDGRFQPGVQVTVRDGRIEQVGRLGLEPTHRLSNRALLPGFVNAHSHAFQRGLRGLGERYPRGAGTFWMWREAMYDLVRGLTPQTFREHCRRAFREMLRAGVTTVGEFHYLHHAEAGERDYAFDDLILDTAREVGIRIVLIQTAYRSGGFGEPLSEAQQRFNTHSLDEYFGQVDRLGARLERRTQTLAIAAHSVRAVPAEEIVELRRAAAHRGLVFHMHLEEQRQEIEACLAALGATPIAWVLDHLDVDQRCVAVHATHADPKRLEGWLDRGGRVCLCPLTEASLADGIADVERMARRDGAICVGSDSNARIDLLEEIRWLEYVQRLRSERRGVCADEQGELAGQLLAFATRNGADALGLRAGRIAPDCMADFCAIDLAHPDVQGLTPESLAAGLVFGATGGTVREVCVAGRWGDVNVL